MKIKEGMILVPNLNNMNDEAYRVVRVGMGRVICETLDGKYVGDINNSLDCDDVLYYYNIKKE